MPRVFRHYTEWEAYGAGMWSTVPNREDSVAASVDLLAAPADLEGAMFRVLDEWPISSLVNLSDRQGNRRAWMGQAACCLAVGAPEDVTREAWGILDDLQRRAANEAADTVIATWDSGGLSCQRDIWKQAS